MQPPLVPIHQRSLVRRRRPRQLPHGHEPRARRVDIRTLLQQVRCRPRIVEDDDGPAPQPDRDHGVRILPAPFFEFDPRLPVGDAEVVAEDGQREGPRWEFLAQEKHAGVVVGDNAGER